jgi:type II secretory pathway component PulF
MADQSPPAEATTAPPRPRLRFLAAFLLTPLQVLLHLFAFATVVTVMVRIVPFFVVLTEEADFDLPAITVLTFQVSYNVVSYWYLPALAILVFDAPVIFTLNLLPLRRTWLRPLWFSWPLCLSLFIILFTAAGLIPIQESLYAHFVPE